MRRTDDMAIVVASFSGYAYAPVLIAGNAIDLRLFSAATLRELS
jgi:hypothetical protein